MPRAIDQLYHLRQITPTLHVSVLTYPLRILPVCATPLASLPVSRALILSLATPNREGEGSAPPSAFALSWGFGQAGPFYDGTLDPAQQYPAGSFGPLGWTPGV